MRFLQPRWRLVLAATLLHAFVAGLAVSPLFFMPSVATARHFFSGSNAEKSLFEDVRAYHEYSSRTVQGEIPYRDFDVEYPIGALPFFMLPRLIVGGPIAYRWAFAFEMILFDAALVWLVARRGERTIGAGRAVLMYSVGLGLLGGFPIARFDLAAAFLAFASLMAWESNRAGLAGFLAGFGGLVKLFPGAVALPWMVEERDRRNRVFLTLASTIVIGALVWVAIGRAGVARSLRYHSARGLEIESVYAGILMVVAKLLKWPLSHDYNHSSVELITSFAGITARIAPLVQVAAMGCAVFRSTSARNPGQREVACLLAFGLFGKVLSPQYLLWILPFIATLEGRAGAQARPLLMVACGFTTLLYFWAGVGLLEFHPLAIAILNVRNALLLAIFCVLIRR